MEKLEMEEKLKSLTVVYVEDEAQVLEQVSRALRRRVGKLYTAQDGEAGLALIREHNPDMVVTDLEMPKMTGIEMIKRAKSHDDDMCKVPVVVVTAYQDDEHHTDLANRYVYKPVQIRELVESMIDLIIECRIGEQE